MSTYDKLISSVPVDSAAARVLGRGVHWEPAKTLKDNYVRAMAPLPMMQPPPDAPQVVGLRFGRLRVVGYGGTGANGAKWVVRCDCGAFEHRRLAALKRSTVERPGMCFHCDYLSEIKKGHFAVPTTRRKVEPAPQPRGALAEAYIQACQSASEGQP